MSGGRWASGALCREARRNCGTRGSRTRMVPLLAVVAAFVVLWWTQMESLRFSNAVLDRSTAGHYVLTIHSVDVQEAAEIRVTACEALVADARVDRAGVLLGGTLVAIPQLGADQRVIEASAGLFPHLQEGSALVGSKLPDISGALVVDQVALVPVVLAEQPRGIDVNRSVVLPLQEHRQVHSECVVVVRPLVAVHEAASELIASLDARGALMASGPGLGADDIGQTYVQRVERWISVVVGAVGGLVAAVVNRFRFSEFAVYRLSGTSPADTVRLIAYEQLIVAGFFVATLSASAWLVGNRLTSPTALIWWSLAGAAVWFVTATAASIPAVVRNPVTSQRDD